MPTAAIIGYGPGVGHEVAKCFGLEGLNVALFSRNPAKYEEKMQELKSHKINSQSWTMNAADEESIEQGLTAAVDTFGPLNVLVYNAVAFRMATPTKVTPEELLEDFRANVAGALAATRRFLKLSEGQKDRTILLTGGGWALYPDPVVSSTAIGKAGLRHLGLMLHEELKPMGVKVSMVTILGSVASGTPFDPAYIAQEYLKLYRTPMGTFPAEVQFTGK